jgi:hypothetical protein
LFWNKKHWSSIKYNTVCSFFHLSNLHRVDVKITFPIFYKIKKTGTIMENKGREKTWESSQRNSWYFTG